MDEMSDAIRAVRWAQRLVDHWVLRMVDWSAVRKDETMAARRVGLSAMTTVETKDNEMGKKKVESTDDVLVVLWVALLVVWLVEMMDALRVVWKVVA